MIGLYGQLYHIAKKYPHKTAIIFNNDKLTYKQLIRQIDTISNMYEQELKLSTKQRIGLLAINSIEWITYFFALDKIKITCYIFNPYKDDKVINNLVEMSGLDLIFVDTTMKDKIKNISNIVWIKKIYPDDTPVTKNKYYINDFEERVVAVQCSSGTTGISKRAQRTVSNYMADFHNIIVSMQYTENEIVFCPVPLSHGYGLTMGVISTVLNGGTLVLQKWFMPNRFFTIINNYNVTVFLGTPAIYDSINRYEGDKTTTKYPNVLLSSGDSLSKEIAISFYHLSNRWIQQMYGLMETSTVAVNLDASENTILSVGKKVKDVDIKLLNKDVRGVGEILISSKSLSNAYIEKSIEMIEINGIDWYATGDLGKIIDDNLYILGRKEEKSYDHDNW